jgi:peptidoglycan/xylan/chitin deacetylase (PgdA/CDA1 family)
MLAACSGAPQHPVTPAATESSAAAPPPTTSTAPSSPAEGRSGRPHQAAIQASIAVTALPTLPHGLVRQQAAYRVVDGDVHLDVAVPQLRGTPILNRRLKAIADTYVRSFRRTLRNEASKGPGRYHAMTIGWQLLGHSAKATGIKLWVAQQHGLKVTIDQVTVWYDPSTKTMLAPRHVVRHKDWSALQSSISRALAHRHVAPGRAKAALAAPGAPDGKGPTFGFSPDGDLVITFAAGVLSAGLKPVSVRIDSKSLESRLSPAGRSARAASQARRAATTTQAKINCAKRKCAALTFDDGPGPFTAELVALLQQRKVPATFFVVGNRITQSPDLLAVVDSAGMEIGNHSSYHRELTLMRKGEMETDLEATSKAISAVTGHRPTLLRPPYGSRNAAVDAVSKKLGMAEILWDVDTQDWLYPNSARVRSAAVGSARPGSIILMHDVNRTTVAAVPRIIDDLQRRGFSLVTVSQLLAHHDAPGHVYRRQAGAGPR